MELSKVADMLSTFQRNVCDLREAEAVANRIIKRSTISYERSLLIQQQLSKDECWINRLLTKVRHDSHLRAGYSTASRVKQPGEAPPEPPLVKQLRQQHEQRSELLRRSAHDLKSNFDIISFANFCSVITKPMRTDK